MNDREMPQPMHHEPHEEPPVFGNGNNGQKLLAMEAACRGGGCNGTCRTSGQWMKTLTEALEEIRQGMAIQREQIAGMQEELKQQATEKRVMATLQEQNRQYAEQFHEREVLTPVFISLIGIADRCREQVSRLRRAMATTNGARNVELSLLLKSLIDSREGDRIEIEELLANYGVESFQGNSDKFDVGMQKCVRQQSTEDPCRHCFIARRLAPGYRRNGRILRQEHVSVFVLKQPS